MDTCETEGIFDDPIPVQLCELMGIVFDTYNLETREVTIFLDEHC